MTSFEDVPDNKKEWWDLAENRWRLYVQIRKPEGYYLLISAPPPHGQQFGPQPVPFFAPSGEPILEQIGKPEDKLDRDIIEVALMSFESVFLKRVRECLRAGKLRQARLLWIARDPRFAAITDEMWERFA